MPVSIFLRRVLGLVIAGVLLSGSAAAHGIGTSQLRVRVDGARIDGEWELHLHDARLAVGLDPKIEGEEGVRELRRSESAVRAYLARQLRFTADSIACPVEVAATPLAWHPENAQVLFHVTALCPKPPTRLGVRCDLLFELEPAHRAYFSIEDSRVTHLGVFTEGQRSVELDIRQFHAGAVTLEFLWDGFLRFARRPDHVLFLMALLLPAVLVPAGSGGTPQPRFAGSARAASIVIAAFAAGHSLTLALAFFGLFRIREQWIEVGVAASLFAAAWHNVRRFLPGSAWAAALGLGLFHGLSLAGSLANLSLPRHARPLALGSFNAGVELAQLSIAALILPLLHLASRRRFYPRFVLGFGSLVIAWFAAIWVLERSLVLSLFARR